MSLTQRFQRQAFRQTTGIRHFQSIGKEHHLHAGVAAVITMSNRIHNSLGNNITRNFVSHRCLSVLTARTNSGSNLRHHEVDGLIDHLKYGAFVSLIRWNWFCHFRAMEMSTLDFRCGKESLWLPAKQQHRRIGRMVIHQQIQMRQKFHRPC